MKSKIIVTAAALGVFGTTSEAAPYSVANDNIAEAHLKYADPYVGIDFDGGAVTFNILSSGGNNGVSTGFARSWPQASTAHNIMSSFNGTNSGSLDSSNGDIIFSAFRLALSQHLRFFEADESDPFSSLEGQSSDSSSPGTSPSISAAPLPSSLPLFATGLVGLLLGALRRTRQLKVKYPAPG